MLLNTVLPHPSASVTYPVGTGSDVKLLIPLLGVHLRSLFGLSWAARYLADFRRKRMRKQGKSHAPYAPVGSRSPLSTQIGVLPNNRIERGITDGRVDTFDSLNALVIAFRNVQEEETNQQERSTSQKQEEAD